MTRSREVLDIAGRIRTGRGAWVEGKPAVLDAPALMVWLARQKVTVTIDSGDISYTLSSAP